MEYVKLEEKDRIAVITMNRPEKRNALNLEARQELYNILKKIDSDKNIRSAIITGAGKAFIAGADIQAMKNYTVEDAIESSRQGSKVFSYIEKMRIPIIAAINGWALGGGLELALACDIRICSENAQFGQPEIKIGILPGYGASIRLPRIIGVARAKEMIYFGEIITAKEAEKIGLVTFVTSPSILMGKAMELAQKLIQGPASLSLVKQAINSAFALDLNDAFELSSKLYGDAYKTNDAREGILAYLEKRKPIFKGH
ncbi:MAG: enoyl-CoA hydratase/isomerase family protein [Deltaproteobacteria bacterium]|uniref:enoyl-CoA hydratase/isomerase family protein n=1 Tax=Desulfobacula sp. TaxID=2593537 RepID=UPI0019A0C2C2|nr:enoyl-CoA hydratase/isomerase family protein [Candidatus Desulfobacula maris]MBL6993773.1 enoyl-CoA hydratase/isomerase family protein [Desulfobacula sp.]